MTCLIIEEHAFKTTPWPLLSPPQNDQISESHFADRWRRSFAMTSMPGCSVLAHSERRSAIIIPKPYLNPKHIRGAQVLLKD